MAQPEKKRKLKPIEICPNGHHYNALANGDICAVCGAKLDFTAEMTEEELDKFVCTDESEWVCGFLVCIGGRNKGQPYIIHAGKNYVGSSSKMDIYITGDRKIEKENHAVILYDPVGKKSILLPGESRGMVYWQGEAIFEPQELAADDRVELGDSCFRFVPFCSPDFDWKDNGSAFAVAGKSGPKP